MIATKNQGKVREVQEAFSILPYTFESLEYFTAKIPQGFEVEESGSSFVENARIKAKAYGELLQLPVLADDSGLCVSVLDDRPGIYSHRYGKTDNERNSKILEELKGKTNREAYFMCALVLYDPQKNRFFTTTGKMTGTIAEEKQGSMGFGYDPIFINEFGKTNAEITTTQKNAISHRGKALEAMKLLLEQLTIVNK